MLKKFDIEIKEELARVVAVEAETLKAAIDKVIDMYDEGKIILDADDFVGKAVLEYNPELNNQSKITPVYLSDYSAKNLLSELSVEMKTELHALLKKDKEISLKKNNLMEK